VHRSYVSKEWIDSFIVDNKIAIPPEACARFFSVVRIKAKEQAAVFDGNGREVAGVLAYEDRFARFLNPVLRIIPPPCSKIILVQAALDDSKLAETIKRGSEYGIDRFIIFNAQRSEKFCFKKLLAKKERFERIAQDACRQSERLFIPTIEFHELMSSLFVSQEKKTLGLFGDSKEQRLLSKLLWEQKEMHNNYCIVVGPEGGLTEAECSTLHDFGFIGVQWAPFVLRSELACLSPVSILQAFLGRA
jgi:16S rRNA (uracil1498-N3)-methyltransferase